MVLQVVIDRCDPSGPYVRSYTCAVQYHEQNPQFNDEVKLQLPSALDATDHLLFTFTHISVANALSPKASNEVRDINFVRNGKYGIMCIVWSHIHYFILFQFFKTEHFINK